MSDTGKLFPSRWINQDGCVDVDHNNVKPLFNPRNVEIKPIVTSIHQTDDDDVTTARVIGVMKFAAFYVVNKEFASDPGFEAWVKRTFLEEMHEAMYGPIDERVSRLKSAIGKSDSETITILAELDALLEKPNG